MADLLECRSELLSDAVILYVSGEADMETAAILEHALGAAVESGRHIVVDLSGIRYIDCFSFRVLDTVRSTSDGGRRLVLSVPAPRIRRIIDILHFDQVIPVFPSTELALEFVRRPQEDEHVEDGEAAPSEAGGDG